MQVQNNSSSFQVWTNYVQNNNTAIKFLNQIASGRFSASDNPANMGISSRMLSQISADTMAVNNVDKTISAVQVADSWTSQASGALSRMKELAIRAGDGTLSAVDKENLATEFKSLQNEITRITSNENAAASFNGIPLLQGGKIETQVGSDPEQMINVELADLSNQNTEVIGEVVTYDNSGNAQTTEVHWNDVIDSINGLEITDETAIGSIDEAIDYAAGAQVQNSVDLSRLEKTRDALMSYESNLREAESKTMDVDIALAVANYTQAGVLSNASQSMLAQSNQLSGAILLELMK